MSVPTVRIDRGECLTIPYTPGSAATAGTVVVQNDLIGVVRANIDANDLGELQVVGPQGIWIFPKSSGTGSALAVGQVVYWDAGNTVVTTTAGAHKVLGKVAVAAGASATIVYVMGVQQATP